VGFRGKSWSFWHGKGILASIRGEKI